MINGAARYRTQGRKEIHEKRSILALCSILFVPPINNFINSILQVGMSIELNVLTPISYIFMAFCSVFFLYKSILKNLTVFIFSLFIIIGAVASYLIYPEIRTILYSSPVDLVYSPLNSLFYYCIPAMIGIVSVKDFNQLLISMKKWSRVTLVIGIITYTFVCLVKGRELQYMVYSYHMLIAICVCFVGGLGTKRGDIILAIIGSICIVSCGARGAVISLLLFLGILCISAFTHKATVRNLMLAIFLLIIGTTVAVFYDEVISSAIDFFNGLGIESRFLTSLSEGSITESAGRERIFEVIIEAIKQNPFGYGFFADRYVIVSSGMRNAYTHNFFLEVICDFGVIFGSVFIIFFIWRMLNTIHYFKSTSMNKIISALIPFGLFQLLFSSSFLVCPPFFMLMGIFFFTNFQQKSDWRLQ